MSLTRRQRVGKESSVAMVTGMRALWAGYPHTK